MMSAEDILSVIISMASKCCELDIVPTTLLKDIPPHIIDSLVKIINASLEQGVFSEEVKVATVRPLLRKLSLELRGNIYRPVSNLSFLSKVQENVPKNSFMTIARSMHPYQITNQHTGSYSCKTVLIKLMNDLLWNMENSKVTAFVAIDPSAAFDTIDHRILVDALQHCFGVIGEARKWIESCLSQRQFKVNMGKAYSEPIDLEFSVLQDSCA